MAKRPPSVKRFAKGLIEAGFPVAYVAQLPDGKLVAFIGKPGEDERRLKDENPWDMAVVNADQKRPS